MDGGNPRGDVTEALWAIADELAGIRQFMELVASQQPEESDGCTHPRESRVPFGRTNGVEDWLCRECGYRVSEAIGVGN